MSAGVARPPRSRRRLRRAFLLAPLLAAPGCMFVLCVPDTHDDMHRRIDAIALPPEFQELYRSGGGLRSGFAAASAPYVTHGFAAPWRDRALCDELEALARSLGTLQPVPSQRANSPEQCTFQLRIRAGVGAHLVGVGSYHLWISARSRKLVRRFTNDAKCRDELRHLGSIDGLRPGVLGGRSVECWLPPGSAVVEFSVTGRQIH